MMSSRRQPSDVDNDEEYVKGLYRTLDKIRIASLRTEVRRALREQVGPQPQIRIRRCSVVYQTLSGEFCKYYFNKVVSLQTA